MSDAEAETMFRAVRWPDTNGAAVCCHCGGGYVSLLGGKCAAARRSGVLATTAVLLVSAYSNLLARRVGHPQNDKMGAGRIYLVAFGP